MELNIIKDYIENNLGITQLCAKYKMGKLKIKDILTKHNIPIKKRGGQPHNKTYIVDDIKINKFPPLEEGWEYIAVCKKDGKIFKDYLNKAGTLINHLKKIEPSLEIPSDWKRLEYYKMTGIYWWEDYYDVIPRKIIQKEVKICSICGWATYDIYNKSGALEQHLNSVHQISKEEYIEKFPDELEYFHTKNKTEQRQFETDKTKYVTCAICGKKLSRIDGKHLVKHGITQDEYIRKYNQPTVSRYLHNKMSEIAQEVNVNMSSQTYMSSQEITILNLLKKHGLEGKKDRQILNGKEIDIFIPSLNIGIELNGVRWHSEWCGKKSPTYHLDKTLACEKQGISLLHIFEDEYTYNQEWVLNHLKHLLKLNTNLPKIGGRKCEIIEIPKDMATNFSKKHNPLKEITGEIHLAAKYNEIIVSTMSFKKLDKNDWLLTNFTSNNHLILQGVGSKILKYFIKTHKPQAIKAELDRRWVLDKNYNVLTLLGFQLISESFPDYKLLNGRLGGLRRLSKDYIKENDETLKKLGYDRIWDCGLLKYVWFNPNKKEED